MLTSVAANRYVVGDVGTPSRREYLSTFHTSAEELGEIAAQAHPKLLALTHILQMAGEVPGLHCRCNGDCNRELLQAG